MHRPPTLTTFLDYGGDLTQFPGLDGLAEAIVGRRRLNTPAENACHQRLYAQCVERWLRDGPAELEAVLGATEASPQCVVTAFAWAAECYADPAVALRFEAALPADIRAEQLEWVAKRRAQPGEEAGPHHRHR